MYIGHLNLRMYTKKMKIKQISILFTTSLNSIPDHNYSNQGEVPAPPPPGRTQR